MFKVALLIIVKNLATLWCWMTGDQLHGHTPLGGLLNSNENNGYVDHTPWENDLFIRSGE